MEYTAFEVKWCLVFGQCIPPPTPPPPRMLKAKSQTVIIKTTESVVHLHTLCLFASTTNTKRDCLLYPLNTYVCTKDKDFFPLHCPKNGSFNADLDPGLMTKKLQLHPALSCHFLPQGSGSGFSRPKSMRTMLISSMTDNKRSSHR